MTSTKEVENLFPQELAEKLDFTENTEYIIIKGKHYLGSENFAKIASIARSAGGEYISAGKESHFRISKIQANPKLANESSHIQHAKDYLEMALDEFKKAGYQ